MAERLRLRLAPVANPVTYASPRYRSVAATPDRCPRAGCGGLMKPWPDGKLCAACGRVVYVERPGD